MIQHIGGFFGIELPAAVHFPEILATADIVILAQDVPRGLSLGASYEGRGRFSPVDADASKHIASPTR